MKCRIECPDGLRIDNEDLCDGVTREHCGAALVNLLRQHPDMRITTEGTIHNDATLVIDIRDNAQAVGKEAQVYEFRKV
jgi:hypothetical protein